MRSLSVRALVVLPLVASCVVIRPPKMEERPRWRLVAPATYASSCVQAEAWIRKSGKTGMGLALRLRSTSDCSFAITGSRIAFGSLVIPTGALAAITLEGRSQLYAWFPVKFDNDRVWNDDKNDATLALDVTVAGAPAASWTIGVHQQ